jgi:hypothetical protein
MAASKLATTAYVVVERRRETRRFMGLIIVEFNSTKRKVSEITLS